ncbi:unnamed protein product [Bemisia tabaci]|uniref:Uncharacterized protein n=1 Tax=Bemisia tabaci TaxID=7038 RepID=A0A9P0F4Y0_BEMTA|nr:unnamed protein product [Bemisia tabaci]
MIFGSRISLSKPICSYVNRSVFLIFQLHNLSVMNFRVAEVIILWPLQHSSRRRGKTENFHFASELLLNLRIIASSR